MSSIATTGLFQSHSVGLLFYFIFLYLYPANEPYFSVLCITSDLVAVVTDNWTVQSNDVVILELGFSLSSRFAGVVVCLFVFILICFCYYESSDWLLAFVVAVGIRTLVCTIVHQALSTSVPFYSPFDKI